MSVIIKGMKLPKNCDDCRLRIFAFNEMRCRLIDENVTNQAFAYKRHPNCPLVEIRTRHGRLIDADKLQTAIHGCLCETCQTFPCEKGIGCLIEDVFNLLDEAPTIIESEVSE